MALTYTTEVPSVHALYGAAEVTPAVQLKRKN